jgi:hypothetical protein
MKKKLVVEQKIGQAALDVFVYISNHHIFFQFSCHIQWIFAQRKLLFGLARILRSK